LVKPGRLCGKETLGCCIRGRCGFRFRVEDFRFRVNNLVFRMEGFVFRLSVELNV
jgi:hypothetical protein